MVLNILPKAHCPNGTIARMAALTRAIACRAIPSDTPRLLRQGPDLTEPVPRDELAAREPQLSVLNVEEIWNRDTVSQGVWMHFFSYISRVHGRGVASSNQ